MKSAYFCIMFLMLHMKISKFQQKKAGLEARLEWLEGVAEANTVSNGGNGVPPRLLNGISDHKQNLAELKVKLEQAEKAFADLKKWYENR